MTQMTGLNRSKLEMKLMLKSTDIVCEIRNSELVYFKEFRTGVFHGIWKFLKKIHF